jgi:hypothetical protein
MVGTLTKVGREARKKQERHDEIPCDQRSDVPTNAPIVHDEPVQLTHPMMLDMFVKVLGLHEARQATTKKDDEPNEI